MLNLLISVIAVGVGFFLVWRNNKKHFEAFDQKVSPILEQIKDKIDRGV